MGTPLVIDFNGPMAFRFCKNVAWVYLPRCKDHDCNILTDSADISPAEKQTYVLSGPKPPKAPLATIGGQPVITVDWRDTNGHEPTADHCYCIFQLPPPDQIFGLRAEWVEITKPDGTIPWKDNYARGLRLYYSDSDFPTMVPPPSKDKTLDATYFNSSGPQYRIEIRLHDRNRTEFPPYADASMCSATMRKLFPPLNKWIVSFTHTAKTTILPEFEEEGEIVASSHEKTAEIEFPSVISYIVGKRAVDCGANTLVFTDGVTLSTDHRDEPRRD